MGTRRITQSELMKNPMIGEAIINHRWDLLGIKYTKYLTRYKEHSTIVIKYE